VSTSPLLKAFAQQVAWCSQPSPFTARVLQRSHLWLAEDAAAHAAFSALADDHLAAATSLRWAGALHHLALRGLSPWADLWPPATSIDDVSAGQLDSALDQAVRAAWSEQGPAVQRALALPPQTNEVQRSAALLPGLLTVAADTGWPLVLLEVGASAGLNLWCERYHHEHDHEHGHDHGVWVWGQADSRVRLRSEWQGPAPQVVPLHISRRAGCDAAPVDLRQPGESQRLASFIWPDQRDRLARLRAACDQALQCMQQENLAVEALPAATFVQRELQTLAPGQTTVLMHSVVWQYIEPSQQAQISAAVLAAATRASSASPLAWLRFEPGAKLVGMELRLRLWRGQADDGQDRLLARCHPHGARIEWLAA
jgi:hypothetical protein